MIDKENTAKVPFSVPRAVQCPFRLSDSINPPSFNDIESTFKVIDNFIDDNIKNVFYNIRKC